jgi:hypothetical protein
LRPPEGWEGRIEIEGEEEGTLKRWIGWGGEEKGGKGGLRGAACLSGVMVTRQQKRRLGELRRTTFAGFRELTAVFKERHGPSLSDRYRRFREKTSVSLLFKWWHTWRELEGGNQKRRAQAWWLRRRLRDWYIQAGAVGLVRITVYERKESGVEAVWGYVLWD